MINMHDENSLLIKKLLSWNANVNSRKYLSKLVANFTWQKSEKKDICFRICFRF